MGAWRLRTLGMFIVMTAILTGIGAIIGAIAGGSSNFGKFWIYGSIIMLAISLIVCFVSYFKAKEMALKMNHARIVTKEEEPRLYKIVEKVAKLAELPMPEVGIVETPMANAFATGRNPQNAAVVATRGILDILPDDELEGVIAHEMSHVKNRDILVMSIASALSVVITYAAQITYYAALFNRDTRENNPWIVVVALVAQILVPIAALLIQLGISRNREYLADQTGALMINNPRALARALDHLENGIPSKKASTSKSYTLEDLDRVKKTTDSISSNQSCAHMWIANPLKKGSFKSLFSTHPPMEERIARLNKLADEKGL